MRRAQGKAGLVAPAGRIDSNTSADLERTLFQRLSAGETRLVVDLAAVEYISSAGLRVLLKASHTAQDQGGLLVLCDMRPSVREVFDLAGLGPLFAIEGSRERAFTRTDEGA